jgi:acetyltransferase-like isoleucine patch superfamily enzyme
MLSSLKKRMSFNQKRALITVLYSWRWPRDILFCLVKGLKWHHSWQLWGLPIIQEKTRGSIEIGTLFHACSDPRRNPLGIIQKVILKTLRPGAQIIIGDNFGISGATVAAAKKIVIGNNVLIGTGVIITDTDMHPLDPDERMAGIDCSASEVRIEDNVFIGARAIVLKGITIGKDSIIGAGSVVSKNIPAGVMAAGNPAVVVKPVNT